MPALARLRRSWLEERAGHPVDAPGFEEAFAEWWRVELPRRTFWLAEVGTDRSGFTAIGSINVVEIVHMPRPGARPGRIGHIGNAFVLASFADRGVPAALLNAVVEHAKDRRYRSLLLAPTAGSSAFYRRAGFAPRAGRCWRWTHATALSRVPVRREDRQWPSRPVQGSDGRRNGPVRLPHGSRTARGRPPTPLRRRSCACGCGSPSAGGCGSCPTATSPAASSAPCAAPGCRWRTRTGSAPIRACPGSGPRPRERPARRSTSRSGSPKPSSPARWLCAGRRPPGRPRRPRRGPCGRGCARRPHRREPLVHRAARGRAFRAAGGDRGPARERVRRGRAGDAIRAQADRRPRRPRRRAGDRWRGHDQRCQRRSRPRSEWRRRGPCRRLCDTDGGRAADDTRRSTR